MSRLAKLVAVLGGVLGLISCGGGGSQAPSPYIAGFNPPAVTAGYTRFVTKPIDGIGPGTDKQWCQWMTPAFDSDQDVANVVGWQSAYGHHALLYATKQIYPIGTTVDCREGVDMTSVTFLGGIGGEGASDLHMLPEGVVFRLPKGQAIFANIHVLNVSDKTITGQAVLDVKYAQPSPNDQIADIFANLNLTFAIPPHSTNYAADATCTLSQDLRFFAVFDHMHSYGVSAYTEVTSAADGSTTKIVNDPSWVPEYQYNPAFVRFPVDQPLVLHQGDVVHTHCVWNGDATKTLTFPDEMCVMSGFFVANGPEIYCINGQLR